MADIIPVKRADAYSSLNMNQPSSRNNLLTEFHDLTITGTDTDVLVTTAMSTVLFVTALNTLANLATGFQIRSTLVVTNTAGVKTFVVRITTSASATGNVATSNTFRLKVEGF